VQKFPSNLYQNLFVTQVPSHSW